VKAAIEALNLVKEKSTKIELRKELDKIEESDSDIM